MRTFLIFSILLLWFNFSTMGQYFKVVKIRPSKIWGSRNSNSRFFFKIALIGNNTELELQSYPISLTRKHYNETDTLAMIEELLNFEGDTRICALPITCYNPKISQLYLNTEKRYSIQLEALFIINQLFFTDPFLYSPYPALYDNEKKKIITIKGISFSTAFYNYRSWFIRVKRIGIEKSRELNDQPLDSASKIRWYR